MSGPHERKEDIVSYTSQTDESTAASGDLALDYPLSMPLPGKLLDEKIAAASTLPLSSLLSTHGLLWSNVASISSREVLKRLGDTESTSALFTDDYDGPNPTIANEKKKQVSEDSKNKLYDDPLKKQRLLESGLTLKELTRNENNIAPTHLGMVLAGVKHIKHAMDPRRFEVISFYRNKSLHTIHYNTYFQKL